MRRRTIWREKLRIAEGFELVVQKLLKVVDLLLKPFEVLAVTTFSVAASAVAASAVAASAVAASAVAACCCGVLILVEAFKAPCGVEKWSFS